MFHGPYGISVYYWLNGLGMGGEQPAYMYIPVVAWHPLPLPLLLAGVVFTAFCMFVCLLAE